MHLNDNAREVPFGSDQILICEQNANFEWEWKRFEHGLNILSTEDMLQPNGVMKQHDFLQMVTFKRNAKNKDKEHLWKRPMLVMSHSLLALRPADLKRRRTNTLYVSNTISSIGRMPSDQFSDCHCCRYSALSDDNCHRRKNKCCSGCYAINPF